MTLVMRCTHSVMLPSVQFVFRLMIRALVAQEMEHPILVAP